MAADRFALFAAALLATACNTIVGPSTPDNNWRVHDSARFSLYARPGSFAEANVSTFADVLEDQYTFALRALDVRLDRRISGFLYESGSDAGREGDRGGTAYAVTGAFKATCTPPLDGNLFAFLQHESNHVIAGSALGQAGTHLITEGLASAVMSEHYHRLGRTFLFAWTRDHRAEIAPLADLTDDGRWPDLNQRAAYNAGASFVAYALENYGPERFKALYSARSNEFADRVRSVYGKSLQDLEAEWLRFCATFSAPIGSA